MTLIVFPRLEAVLRTLFCGYKQCVRNAHSIVTICRHDAAVRQRSSEHMCVATSAVSKTRLWRVMNRAAPSEALRWRRQPPES